MTKLSQLSGFLADALDIDPLIVERHARGLRAAGRVRGADVTSSEFTDLLCCVLSTDPVNATGPYHLPPVGAEHGLHAVEITHLGLDPSVDTFGRVVENIIASPQSPRRLRRLEISGRGETLHASITFAGSELRVWFGYRALHELLGRKQRGLQSSVTIDGATIYRVAAGFAPRSAALCGRREVVLDKARSANTPITHNTRIH